MTRIEREEAMVKREFIINRAKWKCEYEDEFGNRCQREGSQVCHMIAKTKANLKKYGPEIVHHPKLLRWGCPEHNSYFNIGQKPAVIKEWVNEVIGEGIDNWREEKWD